MKIYNLKRFSRPDFLCRIDPEILKVFLRKYPACLPAICVDGSIDYEFLAQILSSPKPGMDAGMFDALAIIDEMSNDSNFDVLTGLLTDKPYAPEFGDNVSAADLALTIWLHEPKVLENAYGKNNRHYPRSFIYFRGIFVPRRYFVPPRDPLIRKLTRSLNCVFQRKRRGRNVMITVLEEDDEYQFMIRKGEPLARDSSIKPDGETEQVFYRPERFDLVVLRPEIDEIRLAIYRKTNWIVDAYRTMFGYVFYGEREYFSGENIFTLQPLITDGAGALTCLDIPGLDEVFLMQCQFKTGDEKFYTFQGKMALDMIGDLRPEVVKGGIMISAKFKVKISGAATARMVTINKGNYAEFKYDDDGVIIEKWLIKRGFKR